MKKKPIDVEIIDNTKGSADVTFHFKNGDHTTIYNVDVSLIEVYEETDATIEDFFYSLV